jgi:YD repeat-containing protein
VTDALGRVTTFDYDGLGRTTAVTLPDPDGGGALAAPAWTYTFDAVGNLLTETEPLGNVTRYEYDNLNRLLTITEADPDPYCAADLLPRGEPPMGCPSVSGRPAVG